MLLLTAVADAERDEFEAVLGSFGIGASPIGRDSAVTFSYYTPLSPPSIAGLGARLLAPLEADDSTVLRFGFIESNMGITTKSRVLVVDPQGDAGDVPLHGSTYDRLAIVANEREIRRLGDDQDARSAALAVKSRTGAEAVVVKCGARGAIVLDGVGLYEVGPRPTQSVHPIGSGDAFSAIFAHAFGQLGMPAREAAEAASTFTASYVSSKDEVAFRSDTSAVSIQYAERPLIYLAGPFFGIGQLWLVDLVRRALHELGAEVFSPVHDVGVGGIEVAEGDLAGLDEARCVLALLDEFDAGTVFEIGYAVRSQKPVVGYLDPRRAENLTMLEGTGVEITDDLATAAYQAIWRGMSA